MNREAAEREVAAAASSSSSDKRRSKHKSSKRDDDYYNSSHKSSHHSSSKSRNWVRPHLKVRFIDKKYKHGKYYEKKVSIKQIISKYVNSPKLCNCARSYSFILIFINLNNFTNILLLIICSLSSKTS